MRPQLRAKSELWIWSKVVIWAGTMVLGRGIQPTWLFWMLLAVLTPVLVLSEIHERRSRNEQESKKSFLATVIPDEISGAVGVSQWASNDEKILALKREELLRSLSNSSWSPGTLLHAQRAIHKPEDRTPEVFSTQVESWYQTANESRARRLHAFVSITAATRVVLKIRNQSQSSAGLVRLVLEIPKDVLVWTMQATPSDLDAGLRPPAPYNRQTIASAFASLRDLHQEAYLPLQVKPPRMSLSAGSDFLVATQEFENVHSQDEFYSAPLFMGTYREIDQLTIRWRMTSSNLEDVLNGSIDLVVRPGDTEVEESF